MKKRWDKLCTILGSYRTFYVVKFTMTIAEIEILAFMLYFYWNLLMNVPLRLPIISVIYI